MNPLRPLGLFGLSAEHGASPSFRKWRARRRAFAGRSRSNGRHVRMQRFSVRACGRAACSNGSAGRPSEQGEMMAYVQLAGAGSKEVVLQMRLVAHRMSA